MEHVNLKLEYCSIDTEETTYAEYLFACYFNPQSSKLIVGPYELFSEVPVWWGEKSPMKALKYILRNIKGEGG